MPWKLGYDPELGLVQLDITGCLTKDDLEVSAKCTISLGREKNTNLILVDATKLEGVSSAVDIYNLPQYYDELKSDRQNRLTLILPAAEEAINTVEFYRTVCRNRGWNVENFKKRQEAIDWLLTRYV
jgi:hypothetical protein